LLCKKKNDKSETENFFFPIFFLPSKAFSKGCRKKEKQYMIEKNQKRKKFRKIEEKLEQAKNKKTVKIKKKSDFSIVNKKTKKVKKLLFF
jgi:hypothetical protein